MATQIQESNFTNSGGENKLKLKEKLSGGLFAKKIIYLERTEFPAGGFEDGVLADADMRRHLGQEGLRHVSDVRLDDLFIYNDSDEIPKASLQIHSLYKMVFSVYIFLEDNIP